MKLPLWHRQLKSLCAVTDFNPVEQNCCSSVTHSQAALSHRLGLWGETACTCTVSGTALARSWKQRVPFPPSTSPHLEEGHTENSTLPQVEQLAFLHLASFAYLQEEPGLTIPPWLPICLLLEGNTGPVVAPCWGCSNYHCHWLQTGSSLPLWSCCTGQKHSLAFKQH